MAKATAITATQESNPFIKQLASSNRRTRDAALSSLRTYLHRSTPFTELDFLKLWKGLFFCMWMSDKPLTQQRLARDLADLLHVLRGRENFLGFVDAFWKTMAREWAGIDALRMDKFLYLVRCYVNHGFECVSKQQWSDETLVSEYLAILESVPLNPRNAKIPDGLRYHVVEIYVDELDKVDTTRSAPLDMIVSPLRKLAKNSFTKPVRERAREALDDERLVDWKAKRSQDREARPEGEGENNEVVVDSTSASKTDHDAEFTGFGD